MGSLLYSAGKFEASAMAYERAVAADGGQTVHNLNNLALSYAATRRWSDAVRSYASALRLLGPPGPPPVTAEATL